MMRILIADDHALHRELIRSLLEIQYPEAEFIEAEDFEATVRKCGEYRPSIIILDISMPGTTGLSGVIDIILQHRAAKVLICSSTENPILIKTLLSIGADGFVPKSLSASEFLRGVERVVNQGRYEPAQANRAASTQFSPRQLQVLGMLCSGMANKEIADQLGISIHAVKVHVSAILAILGVSNRQQIASECGLFITRIPASPKAP
jgi:DNA-binding NarL/FixJ family response regulator